MKNIAWNNIPMFARKMICEKAGMCTCCSVPKQKWQEFIPPAKKRLADALEQLSGGTETLGIADPDLLEQKCWDSLTEEQRKEWSRGSASAYIA